MQCTSTIIQFYSALTRSLSAFSALILWFSLTIGLKKTKQKLDDELVTSTLLYLWVDGRMIKFQVVVKRTRRWWRQQRPLRPDRLSVLATWFYVVAVHSWTLAVRLWFNRFLLGWLTNKTNTNFPLSSVRPFDGPLLAWMLFWNSYGRVCVSFVTVCVCV